MLPCHRARPFGRECVAPPASAATLAVAARVSASNLAAAMATTMSIKAAVDWNFSLARWNTLRAISFVGELAVEASAAWPRASGARASRALGVVGISFTVQGEGGR